MNAETVNKTRLIVSLLKSLGSRKSYPVPREKADLLEYYLFSREASDSERRQGIGKLLTELIPDLQAAQKNLRSEQKKERFRMVISALEEILPDTRDAWANYSVTKKQLLEMVSICGDMDTRIRTYRKDSSANFPILLLIDKDSMFRDGNKLTTVGIFRTKVLDVLPKKTITTEDFQELISLLQNFIEELQTRKNKIEDSSHDEDELNLLDESLSTVEDFLNEIQVYSFMEGS